jgi:hypothetical protein
LLGIALLADQIMLVLPRTGTTDLLSYLFKNPETNRHSMVRLPSIPFDGSLTGYARQCLKLAEGLNYLHMQGLVSYVSHLQSFVFL